MYHRVAELASDPQLLSVSPAHFAEHLDVLRRSARPRRLAELAADLRMGRVSPREVAVTFDDGYVDNLTCAKPLLENHDVAATVFVTAGHVGSQHEFWWDELDRLLLQPGIAPSYLRVEHGGRVYEWPLDGAAAYDIDDFNQHRGWHVERPDDPTPRQRVYRSLYQLLHGSLAEDCRRTLDQLRAWAGAEPLGRPSHRTLTEGELALLARSGLVEIGSHTLTHQLLATLPTALQRTEIRRSKAVLEDVVGQPVLSFAYPHGSAAPETVAIVREAGYEYACSTRPDVVWPSDAALQLPRVVVRDWDGDTFARFLRYWLGA